MSYVLPTILDLMEYANDALAQAAFVTNGLVSMYPTQDADHVKATTTYPATSYKPYYVTDPALSLTGTHEYRSWIAYNAITNQRFHIDLGSAQTIRKIYYENMHYYGASTDIGVKNFTFWGSNEASAFNELTYGTDTNWTELTCDINQMVQHVALDQSDPHYVNVTNTVAYRYYAFKFADCWGSGSYMGIRRIELQSALLQSYSEATIKQEGTYALKGIALITNSNGKTLTRTVSPVINLSDKTIIKFDMYAGRTGANIKIGIHDSGGTTTEITPTIIAANTWQTVVWDISAVSNANKDAIDSIIITIVNADAANTFYIDNVFADVIPNYLIHRGRDRFRTAGYSLGN
jgi:hypothetical protein